MRDTGFIDRPQLQSLIDVLADSGYRVIGPAVRDGAIQFDPITDAAQLPSGWRDEQAPGEYRLQQTDSERRFAWANGPQALKPLTFAPRELLWRAERDAQGTLHFEAEIPDPGPVAVLGARACDLAALALHDRHFITDGCDPVYTARRESLLIIAINCTHPAATCFCVSTGDGPEARTGYDLALTELDHGYLIVAGSEAGRRIVERLSPAAASPQQRQAAADSIAAAATRQTRSLPPGPLQAALFARLDHPRWQEVADRCLSCGNCTSVCPTCFCHRESDDPDLGGERAGHIREWDSCFTVGHSYLHGFVVRSTTQHRYRQWMTHKLGGWHSQFGRGGCVGCGRCITWCPVGIDLTEEAGVICADEEAAQ